MSENNEGDSNPTLEKMEGLAKELFRNTEVPQPDIKPERVHWSVRVKKWFRGPRNKKANSENK